MEKDWIEIAQPEIPDEVRQVELPEIGETTPHPKPEGPLLRMGKRWLQKAGLESQDFEKHIFSRHRNQPK